MVKKYVDLREVPISDEVEQYLKAKTKSTASAYRGNLKRFRKFYGKPIPDFLKEVETQREKNKGVPPADRRRYFEETINDFISWMKELGYANNPIRGSLTALQNLFKYYDVPISYSFVKIPPQISKKSNGKHRWKIEEIKEFVGGAKTYRDKAIIMVMFQSGMAVGEICSLDYGDVSRELDSGELPLLMNIVRTKNSNEFKTLLGADAVKYLKLYLGTRHNLSKESPLFAKEGTEKRVTEGAIQNRLRALADKVFGIDEGKMNPYRPHSLRSAFRSRLTGKTDGDLIKFWMGDVLGAKAGAYLILPDEELVDLYSAIEHRLSIETTSKAVNAGGGVKAEETNQLVKVYLREVAEIKDENEILKGMVSRLTDEGEESKKSIKDLREMVEGLNNLVSALDRQMNEFRDSYQTE